MITIYNQLTTEDFTKELADAVISIADAALAFEGFEKADADITIVDKETIRKMNLEFRRTDRVTDVLSFPMNDFMEEEPLEIDPESGRILLGDIVICLQKAEEQAEEYGHSLLREICFLTVHGMLHLLGYDHMKEQEEADMFSRQEEILRKAGIPR